MAALLSVAFFSGCGLGSPNLRQAGGTLQPCGDAPNCVSSLAAEAKHRVEPLRYSGAADGARERLVAVLTRHEHFRVVVNSLDYVHVEATSPIMRYVDDMEFLFAEHEPRIDVRSASRMGYYDFGANRKRVDHIRRAFAGP